MLELCVWICDGILPNTPSIRSQCVPPRARYLCGAREDTPPGRMLKWENGLTGEKWCDDLKQRFIYFGFVIFVVSASVDSFSVCLFLWEDEQIRRWEGSRRRPVSYLEVIILFATFSVAIGRKEEDCKMQEQLLTDFRMDETEIETYKSLI